MNNTTAAKYLENVLRVTAGYPAEGYPRKLAAAAGLAEQAFRLEGEPGLRDLLASLRRIEADDVVIAEVERLHRAVIVRC